MAQLDSAERFASAPENTAPIEAAAKHPIDKPASKQSQPTAFRKLRHIGIAVLASVCLLAPTPQASARTKASGRETISLDGTWQIADSVSADHAPDLYTHTVPVPGLAHSAVPAFPEVDQYQSRELLFNLMGQGLITRADYLQLGQARGRTTQTRHYFWYKRTFTAPPQREVALLRVAKAQFGIEVYVNGVDVGTHFPCFTTATFNVTSALHWGVQNEVVIRVGARPDMLPATVQPGTDFEKRFWTPGIYDDVTLYTADNPVISSVQVAPDLAHSGVEIQTELRNYSDHPVLTHVQQEIFEHGGNRKLNTVRTARVLLRAGQQQTLQQFVTIPHVHLWTPDDPHLYDVVSSTAGDSKRTYFGMREFHFDTTTRRAYLNGKPFFMRGSNITLHRFFEDPESGQLPWTDAWVHRLLVDIPRRLHWNSFRFCIGPVPDRWLQVADENGLLIENEYMVWVLGNDSPLFHIHYDRDEMITEYTEWMRDNWNHPSVVLWDATNESNLPDFSAEIIPAVRGLDLSHRDWEDSYNVPAGPDDPVEDHQYFYQRPDFEASEIQSMLGPLPYGPTSKSGHANILNEYGWLWLNRDGSPTLLTDKLYQRLLGKDNNTNKRFQLQSYLLQGETEFWRAYRHYAGVLEFVYLTSSYPGDFTADNFLSVKDLTLQPRFEHAMEQAFNPLGVYLNFWQPRLRSATEPIFTICLVNDLERPRTGKLVVVVTGQQGRTESQPVAVSLNALGAQSYAVPAAIPAAKGTVSIDAIVTPDDDPSHPVTSHREALVE